MKTTKPRKRSYRWQIVERVTRQVVIKAYSRDEACEILDRYVNHNTWIDGQVEVEDCSVSLEDTRQVTE